MTVFGVLRQVAEPAPPARSATTMRRAGAFLVRWRVAVAPFVAIALLLMVPALTTKGIVVVDLLGVALAAVGLEAAIALRSTEQDVRTRAEDLDAALSGLAARVDRAVAALLQDLELTAGGDVRIAIHPAPPRRGDDADLVRAAWAGGTARRSGAEGSGRGAVAVRLDARDGSRPVGAVVVDGFAPDAALRRLRAGAPWQRLGALLEAGALAD